MTLSIAVCLGVNDGSPPPWAAILADPARWVHYVDPDCIVVRDYADAPLGKAAEAYLQLGRYLEASGGVPPFLFLRGDVQPGAEAGETVEVGVGVPESQDMEVEVPEPQDVDMDVDVGGPVNPSARALGKRKRSDSESSKSIFCLCCNTSRPQPAPVLQQTQ